MERTTDKEYVKLSDLLKAIDDLPNCKNGHSDVYDKARITLMVKELNTVVMK